MEKINYPTKEKCYLVGTHTNCYRAGEPSEIIGVKYSQPSKELETRLCYVVEFSDGYTDLIPVSEIGRSYEIITFFDIVNDNIPTLQ